MIKANEFSIGTRAHIQEKVDALVETVLKPRMIRPEEEAARFNFVVDVNTRWRGRSISIISVYRVGLQGDMPGDLFDAPLARIEYKQPSVFGLSFRRHTGSWMEIYPALSLEECLGSIENDPWFNM